MNGVELALSAAAGMSLGLLFYGGLWLTLRRLPGSRRPALLMLGSLVLRTALILTGLHLAGGGDALRLVVTLAGMILSRRVLMRRLPAPVTENGGWS